MSGTGRGPAGGKGSSPAGHSGDERTEAQQPPVVIRDRRKIRKDAPAKPDGPATAAGPATETAPATAAHAPDEREMPAVPAQEAVDAQPEAPTETAAAEVVVGEVIEPAEAGEPDEVGEPDRESVVPVLGGLGAELEAVRGELEERTRDLQRVTAEYANYRKRVDRDRALVTEQAVGSVLHALLPVLDDLDRAREHGDLVGPFGSVAEQLVASLTKFGLTPFGEKGDPFDPTRHEAVAHQTSAEVAEPTCVDILRRGYLLGERLLRPALVAVADPE